MEFLHNSPNEQLHGLPWAVTNVHLHTQLVYEGPSLDWNLPCPPLPEQCQPGTKLYVREIVERSSQQYYDYRLENDAGNFTHFIKATTLCTFINHGVLRIHNRRVRMECSQDH